MFKMRLRLLHRFGRFQKYSKYQNYSTKSCYVHKVGTKPLQGISIGQLFDGCVEKHYGREVIVSQHENKRFTYEETKRSVEKVANGLLGIGLQRGDRLGLWASNRVEWYFTFIAAAKLGLVLVNLNPMYQAPEIEYCLTKVGVKAIITDDKLKTQNYYQMLCSIIPELKTSVPGQLKSENVPDLRAVIVMSDEKLDGTIKYDDLMNFSLQSETLQEIQLSVNIDDPFNIQFTSGTTGKPKAATASQHNVLNNSYSITERLQLQNKHHKICVQNPFFHAFGITPTLVGHLHWGATLVLPSPIFSPTNSLKAIHKEKCTVLYGTPSMYVDLINVQNKLKLDISPRIALIGGAPCSPQLFKQIKDVLKIKSAQSLYGLTETTAGVFVSRHDDEPEKIFNTVGHLLDHLEVKVIDKQGNTVQFGTAGELCVRGYANMLRYWKDQGKTEDVIGVDRWLKTGDQFVVTEDGYGSVVGRLKDMIIRGGENIYPKEIEDFLTTHPDIKDVQIVGVPDERLGEEVCAFVTLKADKQLDLNDLKAFCENKITYYKIPKYLRIVEEFPKTTSGKIQKFKLLQMFNKQTL